ncbi:hypothetical protein FRC01_001470, partial [Tulasnella sp. 417]
GHVLDPIDRLNAKAPIPSSPAFQPPPINYEDNFAGQVDDSSDDFSTSDDLEARLPPMFSFAVRQPPAQQFLDPTFLHPMSSNSAPPTSSWTTWRARDELADEIIDEFEQQPPHPLASFEESADRGAPPPVPEPIDATMSDQEQVSTSPENAQQIEATDAVMNDATSIKDYAIPSSSFPTSPSMISPGDSDVNMGDPEDGSDPRPLERETIYVIPSTRDSSTTEELNQPRTPETNPGRNSPPATSEFANVPSSNVSLPSAQPLQTPEFRSEVEGNRNVEVDSIQRQVALINRVESPPAPTPNANSGSTFTVQVSTSSTTTTNSTAGPPTPTSTSSERNSTGGQGQSGTAHASRVHHLLGKLALSKQASKSTQPSTTDEASEEAEAHALIARLKSAARRDAPKTKPLLLLPSSEPKPTKGSASRSLMNDLVAGFRRSTNSNPSSKQVTAAAQSATQLPSAPTNTLSTSAAVPSTHHRSALAVAGRHPPSVAGAGREVAASLSSRAPAAIPATANVLGTSSTGLPAQQASLPVVAGRQRGSKSNLPSSAVGTSRQAAAWSSGRAPSTVSPTGEANGPPGGSLTQAGPPSEAVPHETAPQSSGAGMDGVESEQRVIKSSRRVERLARMGVNWQLVQQQAQQTQAELDAARSSATASAALSSRERNEEELRTESQRWHAAQPPPPPEALPFIDIDEEPYNGDPNDEAAYLDWLLSLED